MYTWLSGILPPGLATALAAAWYTSLAVAVFLAWGAEPALFFYLR